MTRWLCNDPLSQMKVATRLDSGSDQIRIVGGSSLAPYDTNLDPAIHQRRQLKSVTVAW